ncbi:hypothetical protein N665_0176s0024 [Sinapis alba]|nr:hypothetical protein N665_0176s0024 [Sinapis alba]
MCGQLKKVVSFPASEDTLKPHKSKLRGHRSSRSCHKTLTRSLLSDSQWINAIPNPSKEQLIDIVQRHFMSQQMDELQVIMGFVQAAKRMKRACKLKSKEARNTDLNCIS